MRASFAIAPVLIVLVLPAPTRAVQSASVNSDASVLAAFDQRVKAYADLRDKVDHGQAALKETRDPAKIAAAQDMLAARIRTARAGAKPGDIFSPDIQRMFHRLLQPELKGKKGAETKAAIKDEAPGAMTLKVNTRYPEKAPLSTVPPNVLASLPKLPEGLEYRFVSTHLILLDGRANLIVDFIPNAIA